MTTESFRTWMSVSGRMKYLVEEGVTQMAVYHDGSQWNLSYRSL